MVTTHQYLDKYPILEDSEKLIVGTIHPHDHNNFEIPFFYGNKLSLWNILNKAFNNEIGSEINLDGVLRFLNNHKISVSDTIINCKRIKPTALDKDLEPIELNTNIINQIKKSNIKEIYFTSGFQKNNAFKLFYADILGYKITKEIRQNLETTLNESVFGRPIKLTILYSPSGSSNVGLSKSKIYLNNIHKYSASKKPVLDFKIDYYRDKFTT